MSTLWINFCLITVLLVIEYPEHEILIFVLSTDEITDLLILCFFRIGDGLVDFSPTPENNRLLFNASYAVDRTLVIRYSDDSIDQSPSLVEVLTTPQVPQNPRYVEQRILPGTHLTPVSPFTPFTTKRDFDPVTALSQAALSMSQRHLALTAREIITWLEGR